MLKIKVTCRLTNRFICLFFFLWLFTQGSAAELESHQSHQSPVITSDEDKVKAAVDRQPLPLPSRQVDKQEGTLLEDGYEVMKSIAPSSGSPKPSIVVLKEPSSSSAGGTVNLILSLGNAGDSQVQVLDPPAPMDDIVKEASEPVHRVRNTLIV